MSEIKVVLVLEDMATEEWAKKELSRYDQQPIIGPETPDKRKRELFLRAQETLNELTAPPLVVAWDYYFPRSLVSHPKDESPASKDFARALNASKIPVVLASWTGGGELDLRIHTSGAQRFQGHISLFRDENGVRFSPVSQMDKRLRDYLTQDTLAVATVAAALSAKCKTPKKHSLRAAREFACSVAEEKPAIEKALIRSKGIAFPIKGIRLTEMPISSYSMQSLIAKDPVVLNAIKDAVVIFGNATTDLDQIFKTENGERRSTAFVHAWTCADILSRLTDFESLQTNNKSGLICRH